MNFKPVVASLFALGLISSPVMAANEGKEHHKHQKHHARHHEHHGVRAGHAISSENFAQERFMNVSNAKSPVASFDWMNRIHFSGMINVDGKYTNRAPLGSVPGFRVHQYSAELNVNNANLFVDVDVNHCVTGHIGLAYVADSVNLFDLGVNTSDDLEAYTDSIRSDKGAVWANGHLGVDEAYITYRDFANSPFYFRAGKMYVPFGYNPDIYPITESLTQLLSQTRATTAQLGWISNYGLYASVFALDGATSGYIRRSDQDLSDREGDERGARSFTRVENWGANLGYCSAYSDVRYHLAASYLKDIRDVEFLAAVGDLSRFSRVPNFPRVPFFRQSGGAAFHGDATYGPVYFSADYVAALRNLDPRNNRDRHHENETRAQAGELTGTYFTNLWGYNTGFSLGYQRSWEAERVLLPRWRYQGDICVNVLPHTTLALEYHYDRDYGNGGHRREGFAPVADETVLRQESEGNHHHHDNHRNNSTAAIRLGVVF